MRTLNGKISYLEKSRQVSSVRTLEKYLTVYIRYIMVHPISDFTSRREANVRCQSVIFRVCSDMNTGTRKVWPILQEDFNEKKYRLHTVGNTWKNTTNVRL